MSRLRNSEAKQLQQKKYTDDNEGEKHQQRNKSAVTHEIIEKFLSSKACAAHTGETGCGCKSQIELCIALAPQNSVCLSRMLCFLPQHGPNMAPWPHGPSTPAWPSMAQHSVMINSPTYPQHSSNMNPTFRLSHARGKVGAMLELCWALHARKQTKSGKLKKTHYTGFRAKFGPVLHVDAMLGHVGARLVRVELAAKRCEYWWYRTKKISDTVARWFQHPSETIQQQVWLGVLCVDFKARWLCSCPQKHRKTKKKEATKSLFSGDSWQEATQQEFASVASTPFAFTKIIENVDQLQGYPCGSNFGMEVALSCVSKSTAISLKVATELLKYWLPLPRSRRANPNDEAMRIKSNLRLSKSIAFCTGQNIV